MQLVLNYDRFTIDLRSTSLDIEKTRIIPKGHVKKLSSHREYRLKIRLIIAFSYFD